MDVKEKLVELLAKYFNIGDSYAYNLTRVKSAFACGTVGLDDFEEFDDETVEDIASYLIAHGVTVQEWISVDDRLPNPRKRVLIYSRHDFCESAFYIGVPGEWQVTWNHEMLDADSVTHWMPLPLPPKGE